MEYTLDQLNKILKNSLGTIVIYGINGTNVMPLLFTPSAPAFSGLTAEEYKHLYGKDAVTMVAPRDLPLLQEKITETLAGQGEQRVIFRIYHKTKGFAWIHMIMKLLGTYQGKPVILGSFSDVTNILSASNLLLDNSNQMIYVIERDSYDLLFANAVAQRNKTCSPKMGQTCYAYVRGNKAPCANCIVNQMKGEEPLETEWYDAYRNKYYEVKGVPMTFFGKKAYAFFIDDLTQHRDLEQALAEEKEKYQAATEGANLRVYEYDILRHSIHLPEHVRKLFNVPSRDIENVPESILPQFQVEDYERVRYFFARVASGEKHVRDEFLMKSKGENGPYLRYTFTTVFDQAGKPVKAYAVAEDITAQKQEEIAFQQAVQALLSANPNTLCSFQLNLTHNICVSEHGASQYIMNILKSDTADGMFKKMLTIIPDLQQRQEVASFFNREFLLDTFNKGRSNLQIDYQRLDENKNIIWVRTFAKMLKDPETQDIISVFSSLDVSEEKQRDEIFKIFTSEEFDYVALLHLKTAKMEFFNISYKLLPKYHIALGEKGKLFDFTAMQRFASDSWIADEDKAYYLQNSCIDVVCRELDKHGHYELSIRGHYTGHPEEMMCRKIQHYYLDSSKDTILIIQSDVTKTYLQQQKIIEQDKKQMEMSVLDTIGRLPSVSSLYKVAEDGMLIPERYSDEFCKLKGCTQENIREFNSLDGFAPVHPDDREELRKAFVFDNKDRSYHNAIYRIKTKHRGYIWVSANFVTFFVGQQKYVYVVYTDINDLKQQEQLLEEKYKAAQGFLDTVSGKYYVTRRINLTTNTIEYTQGTAPIQEIQQLVDYDSLIATIIKHMPQKDLHEKCAHYYAKQTLLDNYKNGITTTTLDYQVRDFDGTVKWVKSTNTVSQRPSNGDMILFNAINDITTEKLSASIMNMLIGQQYDYLACLDVQQDVVVMLISNDPVLTSEEIKPGDKYEPAMRAYNKKTVAAADYDSITEFMTLANAVKKLDNGERCIRSLTVLEKGEIRTKQMEFFYIDKASGLVALVRTDYTEAQRRQIEQEAKLKVALRAAQQANKAKTDFLSNMSHDIRTPLNGIIGMTYLTKEMSLPTQAKENLDKIDTSSKFLLSLINDVLDMAKAESGKITLHLEPYKTEEFYDYLRSIIKPLCDSKGQKFVVDVQNVETVVPLLDKLRINQIFFNLLSNAVKYTPEGGTITFWMRQALNKEGKLLVDVQVRDNGMGMSKEFQKVLFNPFTQEERDSGRSSKQGTGLGLSIVKRLLDLMGGTISVQSEEGKGSIFSIHVEFFCQNSAEQEKKEISIKQRQNFDLLQGKRVLLCEDQALNREIAKALLQKKGMVVDMAFNGIESVDKFTKSAPGFYDVILMDIKMPVMNGYVATENIRASHHHDATTVPIIAMTADAFVEDIQQALAAGMNGHIAKPINPTTMYGTIVKIIGKKM